MKVIVSALIALATVAVWQPTMTPKPVLTVSYFAGTPLMGAVDVNNTVGTHIASNLHKDTKEKPSEKTQCKWKFPPDTVLTILFGAGAIVEPMIFALLVHWTHTSILQQLHHEEVLSRVIREHWQEIEMRHVPTVITHIADMDAGRLEEHHENDEDLLAGATSPPYSLTDPAPDRRCDMW